MIGIKNNTWVVLEIYNSSFSLEIPIDGEITVSDEEIKGIIPFI